MQEGQKAQPRYLHFGKIIDPARTCDASADYRALEQGLQYAGYIKAMIDKRVPGWAAPRLVLELTPEIAWPRSTEHHRLLDAVQRLLFVDEPMLPSTSLCRHHAMVVMVIHPSPFVTTKNSAGRSFLYLLSCSKSRVRAQIEHVFAEQKARMALVVRTIGLADLVDNMRCVLWPERQAAPA